MTWSPDQYLKFETERSRPARDLLQAVPTATVTLAADLGCGPGNSTELLARHHPGARLVGIDSSHEMIAAARKRLPAARFHLANLETWSEPGPWDLLFANASLQWIGHHDRLLPSLMGRLARGGSLAIQMPDNLDSSTHVAMREVARGVPFAAKLANAAQARTAIQGEAAYYALLKPLSSRVDIWRTTYYHPLSGGVDDIVEWVKGTGLIPFLKPLSDDEQGAYLAAYREEVAKLYKPFADGSVLLPFQRLFIVATR